MQKTEQFFCSFFERHGVFVSIARVLVPDVNELLFAYRERSILESVIRAVLEAEMVYRKEIAFGHVDIGISERRRVYVVPERHRVEQSAVEVENKSFR